MSYRTTLAASIALLAPIVGCQDALDPAEPDETAIQHAQGLLTLLPARIEATELDRANDYDSKNRGDCGGSGPVDFVRKHNGACVVGYTQVGEWIEFDIDSPGGSFAVNAEIASKRANKSIRVLLDGQTIGQREAPAKGWGHFGNYRIATTTIAPGAHKLRVVFVTGGVDLRALSFSSQGGGSSPPPSSPPPSANPGGSGKADLSCMPTSPNQVGWKGAGLSLSSLRPSEQGVRHISPSGATSWIKPNAEGALVLTRPGIYESFDHRGNVMVKADDVTIRRARIRSFEKVPLNAKGKPIYHYAVRNMGKNLLVEDSEIDGAGGVKQIIGMGDYTVRRSYVHSSTDDAFKATTQNVRIHKVFAWNPRPNPGGHCDAIQTQGGDDVSVSCSYLDWRWRGDDFGAPREAPLWPKGHARAGKTKFGGQGLITDRDKVGSRGHTERVQVRNSFLGSMGYPLATNGRDFEICDVQIVSHSFKDRVHSGMDNLHGVRWGRVVQGDGSAVPLPDGYTSVEACP